MSSKKKEIEEKKISRKKHLKDETFQSILAILLFVFAFIFILASFGKSGLLGKYLYSFLSTAFGLGYFLIPLVLIMLGIAFIREYEKRFSITKIVFGILFFISALGLIAIISKEAGGEIGKYVAGPLIALVDVYATFLLLFAFVVVSLLVIFDTHLKIGMFPKLFRKEKFIEEEQEVKIANTTDENQKEEPQKRDTKVSSGIFSKKKDEEEEFIPAINHIKNKEYTPPPLSLLENDRGKPGVGDIKANANIIKRTLNNFGIIVEMDEITIGPTVTRYTMKPAEGVKLSRIVGLQDNLALALAAESIRIEAPIPGKSLVGIEVPNSIKTVVGLGSLLSLKEYKENPKPLLISIGKDVAGKPVFYDLAKMPHLLIAGTTGSGKSVAVHAILNSLIYRNSPDLLKFIMVDAKRVELTLYNKIPHLLTPVITDAKKTILALKWVAKEMDRRYDILEKNSARDIHSYHTSILEPALKKKTESMPETMPYIVIVIDELADLMQAYPRELESAIVRLAQMSRAVGIHLVLSTQRPSVEIITGLIKANIPTRIALKVGSQIDSRTIIVKAGAEKLVGQGDMLFATQEKPEPTRIQSPFITESEVKKIVRYLVDNYKDEIPPQDISMEENSSVPKNSIFDESVLEQDDDEDDLYEEARQIVVEAGKASTSYLQRKLRIGYSRAARLMDILESKGVIGPADGSRPREVLGYSGYGTEDEENV